MSFTLSTVPLTLLALYLCWRAKWRFIPVMMFMSIFQAASILNIGRSIGVGTAYLLLLAALAKAILSKRQPAQDRGRGNRFSAVFIFLFTLYAVVSALANPMLFQGTLISNPKIGFNVPLAWEAGHLNQLFYLLICVAMFFAISKRSSLAEVKQSLDWYIAGCGLASAIALYQLLCLKTGLPFPSELLHTNPVYGTFEAYEIGGFARINSTFVEASGAAGCLAPALGLLFWRLLNHPKRKDLVYALFIFTGLFLTISTTGYLCFGFLCFLSTLIFLFKWSPYARARAAKLIFGAALAVAAIAIAIIPSVREQFTDLLDIVIFTKTSTGSFEERSRWNFDALKTCADTYWLGAGFGVVRASSVVPTLLGNVGVPGVTLFFGFVSTLFLPAWRTKKHALPFQGQIMLATAVLLCASIVAGPEITSPAMWFFFAAGTTTFPRVVLRRIARPSAAQLPASVALA